MKPFRRLPGILVILLAIFSPGLGVAADIYVSPTGDDSANGSSNQPFRTLAAAQKAARVASAPGNEDTHVILANGIYQLTAPLEFTSADSGRNGHLVIYQNAPGSRPILSGGKQISGWTLHDPAKNIWQAAVAPGDNFRQIYVNGVKATRARSDDAQGIQTTPTGYSTQLPWLETCRKPSDLQIITSPREWMYEVLPVAMIHAGQITIQEPCWSIAKKAGPPLYSNPRWIENAYELLTKPGYWYLDHSVSILYYLPRPGEDMTKATVEVPALEQFIQITGTGAEPVSNLQITGLTFRLTGWLQPSTGLGLLSFQANQLATNSGDLTVKAAIDGSGASHLLIKSCAFAELGGNGINLLRAIRDTTVDRCTFSDLSGTAIQLGKGNAADAKLPEGDPDIVSDVTISNCTIHDVETDYLAGCAIFAGFVERCTITHNELYNLPYGGISLGWGWTSPPAVFARGNRIIGNKIHDYLLLLGDSGGIYCNGHQEDGMVENNYLYSQKCNHFASIYLDDGATNWTVLHNVCLRGKEEDWLFFKGHNNHAIGNYTQNPYVRDNSDPQGACSVENTSFVPLSGNGEEFLNHWPGRAEEIIKNSGPQSESTR